MRGLTVVSSLPNDASQGEKDTLGCLLPCRFRSSCTVRNVGAGRRNVEEENKKDPGNAHRAPGSWHIS